MFTVSVSSATLLARMFCKDWDRSCLSMSLETLTSPRSSSSTSLARASFRLWNPLNPHRLQKRDTVASLVPLALASSPTVISTTSALCSII